MTHAFTGARKVPCRRPPTTRPEPPPWWRRPPPGPRGLRRRLAVLTWLVAGSSGAAELPGGLYLETADGWAPAPTLAAEAAIDIAGMVARVEIRHSFSHPGPVAVEAAYVFPLPEDAAVDTLELRVAGRVVVGEIRPREEARAVYRAARAEGRQAGLVEQERPNLFSLALARVPPGETVHVHIGYYQQARFRDGRFRLELPLTVTPRCLPARSAAPAEPAPAVVPSVYRAAGPGDGLGLSVRLQAGLELASVDFPGVAMRRQDGPDGASEFHPAAGRIAPDRDFRMSWTPALGADPRAAVFRERFGDEEYALVMIVPPHAERPLARPREVILVVDTSGSMGGESIRQARAALARAIDRLGPGDRFNVIEFNDLALAFFPGAVPASPANRRAALARVRMLAADGGTNMAPALELALAGGGSDRLRQVVFVTDGAVGNEDELFTLIRRRLGESRLFTVGIGAAPNGHFMTQAALWGRGTHVRIASQAEVGERMDALLAMLERPALTDVALSFPGGPADVEHWPDRIPDLYAGEPVLVATRLRGAAGPDRRWVRLEGRLAGGHWLRELPLPAGDDAPGVAALWARAKIAGLERRLLRPGAADAVRAELEQVALAHGLVSRYTSLVAVDRETPPAPAAPAAARPVPLIEPAGAEGIRLGALTPTGTGSRQLLARGVLLAFLALLVLAFDPRRAPRWD